MLSRLLESLQFEAVLCRDCREALDFFRAAKKGRSPFDGAIMDLTLCKGASFRRFRGAEPDFQIVVSSYELAAPAMTDPKGNGFSAAMRKPFGLADVRRLVKEVF